MATVTFAKHGVKPPVFIVSSMSTPPWETLEMKHGEENEDGLVVFSYNFTHVPEGTYQYKIRIGDGQWVVDESGETITDDAGNQNNVYHHVVKSQIKESGAKEKHGVVPQIPLPFTVVEKAEDQEQPSYGDIEGGNLRENVSKRTADAEPDIKIAAHPKSHDETQAPVVTSRAPFVVTSRAPFVVVEKVDNRLAFGDDFGEVATSSQKLAYEQRGADALPDKVITITSRGDPNAYHIEPGTEEERAAPLLEHEAFDQGFTPPRGSRTPPRGPMRTISEGYPSPPARGPMDRIDEESSSSVGGALGGPDNDDDDDDFESELDRCPTLDHESFAHTDRSTRDSMLTRDSSFSRRRPSTKFDLGLGEEDLDSLLYPRENIDRKAVNLEYFPTNRDQILERVYTLQNEIGAHESNGVGSPTSVVSQACSSTDLPRFRSATSLNAVKEEGSSDSETMQNLPSPIAGVTEAMSEDDYIRVDGGQKQVERGISGKVQTEASTQDFTEGWMGQVFKPLNASSNELKPLERPRTAAATDTISGHKQSARAPVRQPSSDSMKIEPAPRVTPGEPPEEPFPREFIDYRTPTPANGQGREQKAGCIVAFFRALFASCFGGNPSTRGAILIAGLALAAYYLFFMDAATV